MGPHGSMLRQAPGNTPPTEELYLCIVPLLAASLADIAQTRRLGRPHFSETLEPALIDDLRRGRALLVLDLCNEGPLFHPDPHLSVMHFLLQSGILPSRAVWLDQNRALPQVYHAHFGTSAGPSSIRFEHYDFFVRQAAWQFSPAAGAQRPVADPEEHIARMFDPSLKDRLLLCLNATPRLHRMVTIAGLMHHGLFEQSLVSFFGLDQAKDQDVGSDARLRDFFARNPGLDYLAEACRQVAGLGRLKVDSHEESGNALATKVDPEPYWRTWFSLVTETDFTSGAVDRVTEKTAKAFCLGHPTMVVGSPGALRFMTELGIQDFSDVIDQGYDSEPDLARRLNRIFGQAIALSMAIQHDPSGWMRRVREAGTANIRLATSGGLLEAYVARHERPLIERLRGYLVAAPY